MGGIGEWESGRVREAAETKEKRTKNATRQCLKNRQIVTVSLTLCVVLIEFLRNGRLKMVLRASRFIFLDKILA